MFNNKKGLDLPGWFGGVFAVIVGTLVIAGSIGLLFINKNQQKEAIEEIDFLVSDHSILQTYLRTPVTPEGLSEEFTSSAEYLQSKQMTIAQLTDLIGDNNHLEEFLQQADIPAKVKEKPLEEQKQVFIDLLKSSTTGIFGRITGPIGWTVQVEYPPDYSRASLNIGSTSGGLVTKTELYLPSMSGSNRIKVILLRKKSLTSQWKEVR